MKQNALENMVGNKAAMDWIFRRLKKLVDDGVEPYEALHQVADELEGKPWETEVAPLPLKAELAPEDYRG